VFGGVKFVPGLDLAVLSRRSGDLARQLGLGIATSHASRLGKESFQLLNLFTMEE
jgi:hypothetical protein